MSTCILTKTVPATLRNGGLHYIFSPSPIIISNVQTGNAGVFVRLFQMKS